MRSRAYSKSADRLGDVLELLFAPVLEANVQLPFDFAVHLLGNQDAARIGGPLQPDSNVDPVAVELTVLASLNTLRRPVSGNRGSAICRKCRLPGRWQGQRSLFRCLVQSKPSR